MDTITIRAATPDDAETLSALLAQLGYPTEPSTLRERLGRLRDGVALIAVVDAGPVAFLVIVERDFVVGGRQARIESFVVEESLRGKGIGARVLSEAEAWALERGLKRVGLVSNVVRTRAHAFYERAGYRRVKSQYALEKTLE